MRLNFTTDDGQAVSIDVPAGENVWIETEDGTRLGSLYLERDGSTIGLGRYSEETAWWECSETIPTTADNTHPREGLSVV